MLYYISYHTQQPSWYFYHSIIYIRKSIFECTLLHRAIQTSKFKSKDSRKDSKILLLKFQISSKYILNNFPYLYYSVRNIHFP